MKNVFLTFIKFVFIAFLFISTANASVSNANVKVTYVGNYADGRLFIVVDKQLDPTCANSSWIVLAANHVAKKEIHSNALAALMADRFVDLNTSCNTASSVAEITAPGDYFIVK